MRFHQFAVSWMCLLLLVCPTGATKGRKYAVGSFGADYSLSRTALYLLNETGDGFTIHIDRDPPALPTNQTPKAQLRSYRRYWTVRILDPTEETIFRREYADSDHEAWKQKHVVPAREPGVYQLIINSGMGDRARV